MALPFIIGDLLQSMVNVTGEGKGRPKLPRISKFAFYCIGFLRRITIIRRYDQLTDINLIFLDAINERHDYWYGSTTIQQALAFQ